MTQHPELDIDWIDSGREPQCPPDPRYPQGVTVHMAPRGQLVTCGTALPYPAPRCGYWAIHCRRCGLKVMITAAGRIDDPRRVTLGCRGR